MMTFPTHFPIKFLSSVATLLLLCTTITAQVAFRTTAGDIAPEGLNYFSGKQDTPVQIQQDLKSFPYAVTNSGPLLLYTLQKTPDGRQVTNPVVSVNLESTGTLPLLIFFKGDSPSQPYKIITMREDAASFPGGACRFANFSPIPVQVSFGGDSSLIRPFSVLDKPRRGDVELLNISVPTNGTNVSLITHNILLERDKRYLFMLVPNSSNRANIALKLLTDRPPN